MTSRITGNPRRLWRWLAAGVVALPAVWVLSAVIIGSLGLTAWGCAQMLAVLVVAVFTGLGRRWAYTAVTVVGVLAVVVGSVAPGMLSALYWLVGGLYAVLGVALLVASGRRRSRS